MKDLKYLLAYITPFSAYASVYYGGIWSIGAVVIAFIILPVFDQFFPQSKGNYTVFNEVDRLTNHFFDIILYLNFPILYGLLWLYFSTVSTWTHSAMELAGMTFSVGLIVAILGINVAHELGHRASWGEQTMSKALLLTALYMHFNIEHNRGHHKNVSTDLDPASAKKGEVLYFFWIRSTIYSYLGAWNLENSRLKKLGLPPFHWRNEMIWFQLIQVGYLAAIGLAFGWYVVPFAVAIATIGFLMLETINYIEHYGLRRKKLPSGRYETVSPRHSWNSNHEVGRIFLYELTRHSDHHFKANRKYQILRHMDESPQLPYGYPASMLISLVPPLWFSLMDKEVDRFNGNASVPKQKSNLEALSMNE